ncbi:MAG: slipin family protein [Pirellulaceae bacterium]|jgi:regulator of protease activity HflC (stomatin/prohibitin superfamily)|nr:slipin family protein [Pirellulaceae bacterium]
MNAKIIIRDTHRGALYEDGVLKEILGPGSYQLRTSMWSPVKREIISVDIRDRSLTIKGQEILTADKVAIRVSILVNFRITDVKAALHNVQSYEDHIYEDVQISTRRFLAVRTLDEILKDRNDISDSVREDVLESAASYGVEISRADVKDLVFPGNLREIMNRVLETERQTEAMLIEAQKNAEAKLIQARADEEVDKIKRDADKALAQQLESSPTLLRLRELEALEKMAQHGGNRFVIGLGDRFTKLMSDD